MNEGNVPSSSGAGGGGARSPLVTARQTVRFDQPLELECGLTLPGVEVAYETYGSLNEDKSNAILICHAWTGDAHVTGYSPGEDPDDPKIKPGWWDLYVGPGRAIDTDRYFIICSNLLGGCKGTTGPGSINPETGKPWGLSFPVVTIADMVDVQKRLVDHFGIQRLLCVTGGSMGGMQVLEWAVRYPDMVFGAIPIATTPSLGAQALAFDAVGRSAIRNDADFHNGQYIQHDTKPRRGLAVARMLGHITFLSEEKMHEKFGRTLRHGDHLKYDLTSQFSVETYLDYKGQQFVDMFDANSYLYLTRAMDYFDLGAGRGGVNEALAKATAKFLVISFSHDWLFTPEQSKSVVRALCAAGQTVTYLDIVSNYGHDAFLLPCDHQERAIRGFLSRLEHDWHNRKEHDPADELFSADVDEKRRLDLERIRQIVQDGASVIDLGCGDGAFLQHLKARGCEKVQGVDNDPEQVVQCAERGVDAVQGDLDRPEGFFPDQAFAYVVLSRTMQVVRYPTVVVDEMLRVGKRGVVSFPNFGYWRNRHQIAWSGRVPVTRNLPFTWADTPNLHHLSMRDFDKWCAARGIRVEKRIAMDYQSGRPIRLLANLRATDAIYVISKPS